ncbi:pentapeptide repeat-containing protein [Amycolatopsis nigrescens]|uniref:pentapeptide repeat-containing protein n=1 Tax=Amycolatopsis nigrescens TaxID=381445 RepID=UPI00036B60EC|nr:pentapeptide repeat-containing protein [Amycolatopsis nigrescens]
MGRAWSRPDLPDGAHRELNVRLHLLHARSGHLSSRRVAAWIQHRFGTKGPSHTHVRAVLSGTELPDITRTLRVAEAMLAAVPRQRDPDAVLDEVDALWQAAWDEKTRSPEPAPPAAEPERLVLQGSDDSGSSQRVPGYAVKAVNAGKTYAVQGSREFALMNPDLWFRTPEDAEARSFTRAKVETMFQGVGAQPPGTRHRARRRSKEVLALFRPPDWRIADPPQIPSALWEDRTSCGALEGIRAARTVLSDFHKLLAKTRANAPAEQGEAFRGMVALARANPLLGAEVARVLCQYLRRPYLQDEHEVRLEAQRLLGAHLNSLPSGGRLSPEIEVDLSGATLIDLDWHGCTVPEAARFRQAYFAGDTRFDGATFLGDAEFTGATFPRAPSFQHVIINKAARFTTVVFYAGATFSGALFRNEVFFDDDADVELSDAAAARPSTPLRGRRWPAGWTTVPDHGQPWEELTRCTPDRSERTEPVSPRH